jgi:hypothetical protein
MKQSSSESLPGFRRIASLVCSALAIGAATVGAQGPQPSHDLALVNSVAGKVVRVRDRSGHDTAGRVLTATATELVLQVSTSQRTIPVGDITRVVTKADPVWDGAVMGGAVGAVVQSLPFEGPSCSGRCFSETPAGKIVGVLIAASLGAWWDAKHSHSAVIYEAP